MRAIRILLALSLLAAAVVLAIWLWPARAVRQFVFLPDGSRVSLETVSFGTNHVHRYDHRWQDVFHRILPKKLREKFPPRISTFTSSRGEALMVWLHRDGPPATGPWPPPFFLAVADEFGMETQLRHGANTTASFLSRAAPREVTGWELREYPRRAERFTIRVYANATGDKWTCEGEFAIRNRGPRQFPQWSAETLPATREAGDLVVTLRKLESGVTGADAGIGPSGKNAGAFTRATFSMSEHGKPTEHWSVNRIVASSATGELRPGGSHSTQWSKGAHVVHFENALWLEEAAWKLDVELSRTARFPAEELWVLRGLRVPGEKELVEMLVTTNAYHVDVDFLGVSAPRASLPEGYTAMRPYANVHVRAPHPLDDVRVRLVTITDERGREAKLQGTATGTGTGGRGITPKETLHGFGFDIPDGATTLDVTIAVTQSRTVQFTVKPEMATR